MGILEILGWMLMSIVKFLLTPSLMVAAGYAFLPTLLVNIAGTTVGILIFFYSGKFIFKWIDKQFANRKSKTFTRRNRFIVKMKSRFGVFGLSATIGFMSVPIATLLVSRYYAKDKRAVPFLVLCASIWAVVLTSISLGFKAAIV